MRRAHDHGLLKAEDGTLIGINLGADYCSEHEWGIKELRQKFGMSDNEYGLAKRTIRKIPTWLDYQTDKITPYITFYDGRDKTVLVMSQYADAHHLDKMSELSSYSYKEEMNTAWDEGSFGVVAFSKDDREAVREIHEAILQLDLAIWLGGGGVFQNAGLVLAIVSRVPKDKAQTLHDADVDREKLKKAVEATGIEGYLKLAKKSWFALAPSWKTAKSFMEAETKHSVVFWLNPMEQHIHKSGWFTVEDLELWAEDKGPVMKEAK